MVFKKEFAHLLLYGDEDGNGNGNSDTECKYTSAATIYSYGTINLNKYLNLYVFFIGTFVWFNEVLSYFITNDLGHPSHITLIASASYTASFAIGYFDLLIGLGKKWTIAIYLLLTFTWFHYYAPLIAPETKKQLQIYDMVSSTELEHSAILALSHAFAYVVGNVLYEYMGSQSSLLEGATEYATILSVVYLVCGQFGTYVMVTTLSFLVMSLTTIHYGLFKHLETNVMSNTAIDKCPMYNDGALVLYQTYPVCASIVYIASLFFIPYNVMATHMCRAFWYYSRRLPLHQFVIETVLLIPTFYSSRLFNYFYMVFSVPIITQILRNPSEVLNGCFAAHELIYMDSSEPSKLRDNLLQVIHKYGAFRFPLLDASYIARTSIPKAISANSDASTITPFLKGVNDIAGTSLFSRNTDSVWADLKKELRACVQNPTFAMIDKSTNQLNGVPISEKYSDDNGFEIFNRIISKIMMMDVTGIEMSDESYELCYDKYFKPERESMIDAISHMRHLNDDYAIKLFENTREIYKLCTKLRTDGWIVRLLLTKHSMVIDDIDELNDLLLYASEYKDFTLIHTMNEAALMFLLAVPTTASLSTRCVHFMNYIRDTDNETYNMLLLSARNFYDTYKDKDETLKKPIKNDVWVDFVINALYWWPPSLVSVKLVRETVDIYHPGDIVIISLNCDRDAPAPEKTLERYAYAMEHSQLKFGEALWQDDRVCAGAYFAQNEAAFILAKIYSKFIVSIGEGTHNSYMVSRVDYHMCLHDINS